MAARIFGEAVDDEFGALFERLLPQRAEESVVDRDRRLLLAGEGGIARAAHRLDIDERVGRIRRAFEIDERDLAALFRSEEHTSELQSLMRISYAVFCLKKKIQKTHNIQ